MVITTLSPGNLLAHLHGVEESLGRVRRARWAERTIDLDILSIDSIVAPDAATLGHWMALPPDRQKVETPQTLIVPHPRLQDRPFVLIPLADVLPNWRHPVTGLTVAAMAEGLTGAQKAEIRPI